MTQQESFDDFITSNNDTGISNKEVEEEQLNFDPSPFTNSSELEYVVDQVDDSADTDKMPVSGHIILNQ